HLPERPGARPRRRTGPRASRAAPSSGGPPVLGPMPGGEQVGGLDDVASGDRGQAGAAERADRRGPALRHPGGAAGRPGQGAGVVSASRPRWAAVVTAPPTSPPAARNAAKARPPASGARSVHG